MPKVSVIIPVYNAEKYIERCARSLFEQTLDDIEYIFVNDCTPDKSIEVLCKILEKYPNRQNQVKIINHSVNTGQSGARRDGMKTATGDYIIHCDADDWVELDMYEKLYNKAIETQSEIVCCDMAVEFNDAQILQRYNDFHCDHKLMYDCIAPISVEYFSMCNRLVSRVIYDRYDIQPFEGVNMWDDVGLSVRVRYFANNSQVVSEALYHYNRLNDNSTTKRSIVGRVSEQIRCAECLEDFFHRECPNGLYDKFVAYIKLIAKLDLLDFDLDKWVRIFPEANKYIYILRKQCSYFQIVKSYLAAYCLPLCKLLINVRRRFKKVFL